MKKAVIIYHSKTGRTRSYAEKVAKYLKEKEIEVIKTDLEDFKDELFDEANYIFFGCWTHGLFIILQHPDKEWIDFAAKLPSMPGVKIALFTTYKILTGSMFKNMYKQLKGKFAAPSLELKSRNGFLSAADKLKLDTIIE